MSTVSCIGKLIQDGTVDNPEGDVTVNVTASDSPVHGNISINGITVEMALLANTSVNSASISATKATLTSPLFSYRDMTTWKAGSGNKAVYVKVVATVEVTPTGPFGSLGFKLTDQQGKIRVQTVDGSGNYALLQLLSGATALQPAT